MVDSRAGAESEELATAARALFRFRRSHDYWSPSVHAFWYWHAQEILSLVRTARPALPSDAVGVDVGCGDGFLARKLLAEFPLQQLFGVELETSNIDIIEAENDFDPSAAKVIPVAGNIYSIPIADREADLVVCSEVVEHLTDDARALKELYRILKPGGFLILATPNGAPLPHRIAWTIRGRSRPANPEPAPSTEGSSDSQVHGHINVQDSRYWRSALGKAGFAVDAIRPVTPIYGRESLDRSPLKLSLLFFVQALTSPFSWGHHFSEGLVIRARRPSSAG